MRMRQRSISSGGSHTSSGSDEIYREDKRKKIIHASAITVNNGEWVLAKTTTRSKETSKDGDTNI